jgi:hypothetical protein
MLLERDIGGSILQAARVNGTNSMQLLSREIFRESIFFGRFGKAGSGHGWACAAILTVFIWASGAGSLKAQTNDKETRKLVISSVQVNDKAIPMRVNQALKLGANAKT